MFDKIKTEILLGRRYATRAEARSAIFEWIEVWYNRQRRHSTLGGITLRSSRGGTLPSWPLSN